MEQARRIRDTFRDCGVEMAFDSPTNQQFPVLTREQREALARKYSFNHWADLEDGRSVVRFCTSWATTPQAVEELWPGYSRHLRAGGKNRRGERNVWESALL